MDRTRIKRAPLVDTHAHIFRRDIPFVHGVPTDFERDFEVGDYISELDVAGIPYGVIAAASFLGTQSDYTLKALRQYDRLRGTIIVDPVTVTNSLADLDRAGVVGIRLATGNMEAPPDLRSAPYRKLLGAVAELDWHVHVYGKRQHMPSMLSALKNAGVKIVVDHFGARDSMSGPRSDSFQAILSAADTGRLWVKLSAPYLSNELDHGALASRFLAELGASRLLWGSDWPFVKLGGKLRYQQAVDWLCDWISDEDIRRQIDQNAVSLYRFPPTA